MESRVNNSVRNIIYRLISQISNIILKFVSRSFFIKYLGIEYLGINGLFSEVLQMLSLADLGFGTAMVFSMYKPLADHDETKLAQLVALYKKIYRIIALLITGIGFTLIPFLPYLINMEKEISHIYVYYLLYLANTVASYLVVYKTCILTADQKNYLLSKYDTIFSLISTAINCAIIYFFKLFLPYLIVQVLFTYIRNFYCSYITSQRYPYINAKVKPFPSQESKDLFKNVKSVFIYKLSTTLVSSTDNMLISIIVGTVVVGLYSNYSMIITNVSMFINIIFSSVTASVGNLILENNKQKNFQVYKTMQLVSCILSTFAVSCTYCLINDFITVWIGQEYTFDNTVVVSIVLNLYLSIVLMPIWSYREATGMYRKTKYIMVGTAIVNLLVSIVLGKLIGIAGILIGTSIARLSTYFWYEPQLLFNEYFGEKVQKYYLTILYNVITLLITTFLSSVISVLILPDSWGLLIIKVIVIAAISIFLPILAYIKQPEFKKIKAIISSLSKKY